MSGLNFSRVQVKLRDELCGENLAAWREPVRAAALRGVATRSS